MCIYKNIIGKGIKRNPATGMPHSCLITYKCIPQATAEHSKLYSQMGELGRQISWKRWFDLSPDSWILHISLSLSLSLSLHVYMLLSQRTHIYTISVEMNVDKYMTIKKRGNIFIYVWPNRNNKALGQCCCSNAHDRTLPAVRLLHPVTKVTIPSLYRPRLGTWTANLV